MFGLFYFLLSRKDQIWALFMHVLYARTLTTPAFSTPWLGKLFIFCENICHLINYTFCFVCIKIVTVLGLYYWFCYDFRCTVRKNDTKGLLSDSRPCEANMLTTHQETKLLDEGKYTIQPATIGSLPLVGPKCKVCPDGGVRGEVILLLN